jgi:hypothetical protein
MDLRCESKKHGELPEPGVIEVKCDSRFCGAQRGVVVLHRFDALTGELLETKRFRDPGVAEARKEVNDGARRDSAAVRSA